MDLDHGRADLLRGLDLGRIGGDEKRHADAGGLQFRGGVADLALVRDHVETAFGRALGALLRHDAGRVRLWS